MRNRLMSNIGILFLSFFFFSVLIPSTSAQNDLFDSICEGGLCEVGEDAYQYSDPEAPKSIGFIIADAVQVALGFLGVIFLALIVYAGFRWMTASGNDDQVGKARGLIVNSVIGLVIVLTAYSITYFIVTSLLRATQDQSIEIDI